MLARSVKHGIDRFLIPRLAGPHRYVPLGTLTDMGVTQNALTLAAQRGRCLAEATVYGYHPQIAAIQQAFADSGSAPIERWIVGTPSSTSQRIFRTPASVSIQPPSDTT